MCIYNILQYCFFLLCIVLYCMLSHIVYYTILYYTSCPQEPQVYLHIHQPSRADTV